jgi:hypothetical protein
LVIASHAYPPRVVGAYLVIASEALSAT